ncbi:phage holin family protein [Arsenicicoccus dermatophilus]|uniref:phage holin family protein n=1 Tax=Arsenicicoccus dermatophilus TaxID=1076331 RepID=UPI003916EDB0
MSTSYNEQEHEARRAVRDQEARSYADTHPTTARTIGQLVADATQDVSSIIRNEIQLAKSEMKTDVTRAGKGIAMFAVAGVMAFLGLIFLLHTLAWALIGLGLAAWLAYLVVTLILLGIAGALAMVGKKSMTKLNVKPERTIRNAQETVQALKPAKPTATGSGTNPAAYTGTTRTTGASSATHGTTGTGYDTRTDDTQVLDSRSPETAVYDTTGQDGGAHRADV